MKSVSGSALQAQSSGKFSGYVNIDDCLRLVIYQSRFMML